MNFGNKFMSMSSKNEFIIEAIGENLAKVLEKLNIGRSFRIFGGFGFLISLWFNSESGLRIALLTFIFGSLAKVLEMIHKTDLMKKMIFYQAIIWIIFTGLYFWLINWHIVSFRFLEF